jgi:RsiW-degrading membrane proteinase PrsW (M82 family)
VPKPPAAEDDLFDLADEPEAPAASPIAPPPWPSAIPKPPSAATPPPREPVAASQQAPQPLVGPIQRNSVAARRPLLSGRRYLLFGLALAPLVFMMFLDENDIKVRRESTYQNHPEVVDKFVSLLKTAHDKPFSEKDILRVLPDQRIEGALLSCDSFAHWGYGLLSAAFFAGMLWTLFPRGNADPGRTALVALGTATFGIVFLLALQGIANATDGYMLTGGSIIVLIFYLLKFISFSYHAALDSNNGFLVSFFGYTFGVGLCEEFCKAYPLVFRLGFKPPLDCRGACFWGLASGVGFGVAEGIMYSSIHYNGVSTATIYLVRFTAPPRRS